MSATEVVKKTLAKDGLDYWKRQKVAEAALANPLLSIEECCKAPDLVRDKAASKGSDVHNIIEASFQGQSIDPTLYQDPWKKHVEAYCKFVKEMPHTILSVEKEVYSLKHNYAGRYDAIIEAGGRKILIDYKTSKSVYPLDHALQLGAYTLALKEMGQALDGCAVVHLKADGTYAFIEITPQPEIFLHVLAVYLFMKNA